VAGLVACALHIPRLRQAADARGLNLVPVAQIALVHSQAQAAIVGLDGHDPVACVARVRAQGWHGLLMLVLARGCGASVAGALDAGADDAVALPASAGEIAARLAARMRCQAPAMILGGLRIDPVERRVQREGRTVALLPREYALLLHLARASGRCVTRVELLQAVWGLRSGDERRRGPCLAAAGEARSRLCGADAGDRQGARLPAGRARLTRASDWLKPGATRRE
jgi:two-component system OmpR family response regulator